jgi:hypothetical protein
MRTLISIFCLPEEIDELEKVLIQLKNSSKFLTDTDHILLDISLGISDKLVDWDKSVISKDFFMKKFFNLKKYTDWCIESNFNTSDEIAGCVSQRRVSSKKYNVDNIIWLDTDIIFSPETLKFVLNAAETVKNTNFEYYIITPETVKLWDPSWDCLVNHKFINKEYGYEKTNDPYKDCGIHGDISLESVSVSIINAPSLKFAGGWFTCLSSNVLDLIPIPESFGHYGLEDTFIMFADRFYKKITQFKVRNLVVCEDYKYRDKSHYLNYITKKDTKDKFLKIAQNNFKIELEKIHLS